MHSKNANRNSEISQWSYQLSSAEILFCQVFRHYMRDLVIGETQEERVSRLVAEIARANLDVTQTMQLRAEIGDDLPIINGGSTITGPDSLCLTFSRRIFLDLSSALKIVLTKLANEGSEAA